MNTEDCRQMYADGLRYAVNMRSDALWRAFAAVPREQFLGPGPWLTLGTVGAEQGYRRTPDDDPSHVYHDILVALDPARRLNNGQPSWWAYWLDAVAPEPGDRVAHIGCATGYYTAVLAEVVGPTGTLIGCELDEGLCRAAAQNLRRWPQATAVNADGVTFEPGQCSLIVVSAGVTRMPGQWLKGLAPGGRLLVPLVARAPAVSQGRMLRVVKSEGGYGASVLSYASFYPCVGTEHEASAQRLFEALRKSAGFDVRSVRLDSHDPETTCWLHEEHYCLSTRDAPARHD